MQEAARVPDLPPRAKAHLIACPDALAGALSEAGLAVLAHESPQTLLRGTGDRGACCVVLTGTATGAVALRRELVGRGIEAPLILLAGACTIREAVTAMKGGAFDVLDGEPSQQEVVGAVLTAVRHDTIRRTRQARRGAIAQRFEHLTGREHQLLDGLLAGQSPKEIAWELGLSARTVEVHRRRTLAAMGAHSAADLVRMIHELRG